MHSKTLEVTRTSLTTFYASLCDSSRCNTYSLYKGLLIKDWWLVKCRWCLTSRGGKIGPTRWASPIRSELGSRWAIKLLARKRPGQPARYGPVEFFLPSKDYLARPARFLEWAGLLKFWPKKTGSILARPGFGPARPDPPDCQLY